MTKNIELPSIEEIRRKLAEVEAKFESEIDKGNVPSDSEQFYFRLANAIEYAHRPEGDILIDHMRVSEALHGTGAPHDRTVIAAAKLALIMASAGYDAEFIRSIKDAVAEKIAAARSAGAAK